MEPEHKKKIQLNLLFIKDNLSEVDALVDHLIQMETFSLEQRSNIIYCNATSRENSQRLLDCLIKAGPFAYNNFLKALEATSKDFLVKRLNETVVEIPLLEREATYVISKDNVISSQTEEEENTLKHMQDSIDQYKKETDEKLANMKHMQDSNDQYKKETDEKLANMKNEIQEHYKISKQIQEELLTTKQKLEAKEEEYKTLQTAYKKLKEQLAESRERVVSKNKENVQQKKQIEEMEAQLSEMKKKMESVEEERANMKQVYATLTEKIDKKETEIRIFREEAEKNLKEKEMKCKIFEREDQKKKDQINDLQKQLQREKTANETLKLEVEKINKQSGKPPSANGLQNRYNKAHKKRNQHPSKVQINKKKQ